MKRQMSTKSTPGDFSTVSDISPERLYPIVNATSRSIGASMRDLAEVASQLSLVDGSLLHEGGLLPERDGEDVDDDMRNVKDGLGSKGEMDKAETKKGELVGEEEMETGKVAGIIYVILLN